MYKWPTIAYNINLTLIPVQKNKHMSVPKGGLGAYIPYWLVGSLSYSGIAHPLPIRSEWAQKDGKNYIAFNITAKKNTGISNFMKKQQSFIDNLCTHYQDVPCRPSSWCIVQRSEAQCTQLVKQKQEQHTKNWQYYPTIDSSMKWFHILPESTDYLFDK